jgi:hypothetical protein
VLAKPFTLEVLATAVGTALAAAQGVERQRKRNGG